MLLTFGGHRRSAVSQRFQSLADYIISTSGFRFRLGTTVELANLTIAHGNAQFGGGVENSDGTLTVTNVTFNANSAHSGAAPSSIISSAL